MEPLLAFDVVVVSSILRACEAVSEIVSDFRNHAGSFEGLEVERLNLGIELDYLTELKATGRDSIQKVHDTLEEWQVLEDTMTETIVASGQLLEWSSRGGGLQRFLHADWRPSGRREFQRKVDKVDTW
jgi:hypothetical protein